jgi:eukaryotic-like serine/threonine-protein kinase
MCCPNEEQWLAFLDGTAQPEEIPALDSHLDACQRCRKLTAAIVRSRSFDHDSPRSTPNFRSARQNLEGAVLGRYFLFERLGEGGMGVVYSAYDPKLDRRVAIKLLKNGLSVPQVAERDRLLFEARALAKVSHPNVLTVHDVGEFDDQIFIAMALVDGPVLRLWSIGRPWTEVLPKLVEAAQGLGAAHRAGLVHGDFKPDNVLISSDGVALVTDFGLATSIESSGDHTDVLSGTPPYMAPEQLAYRRASVASDQYSFCLTAWELLCGHRFQAEPSASAVMAIPACLRLPLLRGLSSEPEKRYETMEDLAAALVAAPRAARRRNLALWSTAALVVATAAFTIVHHRTERGCEALGAAVSEAWNDGLRTEARRAFLATSLPVAQSSWERLELRLDNYAKDWRAMRASVCRAQSAPGPGPDDLLRVRCLETAKVELEALAAALTQADDETVRRGVQVADGLPAVAQCTAPTPSMAWSVPVEGAHRELARLEARLAAGRAAETARELERFTVALPQGHPLAADAWSTRLAAMLENHEVAEAEPVLFAALSAAEAGARDDLLAIAAARFAYAVGGDGIRLDVARRWAVFAQGAASRLGPSVPAIDSRVDRALGMLAMREGRAAEAEGHFRRAIGHAERASGADAPLISAALADLGRSLVLQQKLEDAERVARRSLDVMTAARGPEHPDLIGPLGTLADVESSRAHLAVAFELGQRSASIARRNYGPSLRLARTLINLTIHAANVGALEHVVEWSLEAYQMEKQALGPGQTEPLVAQSVYGVAQLWTGDARGAAKSCLAALDGMDSIERSSRKGGRRPERWEYAGTIGCLGDALMQLGRPREAAPYLERAHRLFEAPDQGKPQRALAKFKLAKCLRANGAEEARARRLATEAESAYRELGLGADAAEVQKWLAEGRGRGPR